MSYGFVYGIFEGVNAAQYHILTFLNQRCKKVVLGLFSDDLVSRIIDKTTNYSFDERKEIISHIDLIDDVVEIKQEIFSFKDTVYFLRDKIGEFPSVFVIGSEYGIHYIEDKKLAEELGIELIFSDNDSALNINHIKNILDNEFVNYDVVLFGTGAYFDAYMRELGNIYPPRYAIDNDSSKWNTRKAGVIIKNPEEVKNSKLNHLIVIVCAKNSHVMVEQLLSYGEIDYRIMTVRNEMAVYDEWRVCLESEKKHLICSQRVLKACLREFDRVCNELGLRYYLNCGNIIGALRHNNLIPWDDDIDVIMLQTDFDILKSHAHEFWNADSDYRLVCPGDLGHGAFLDFLNRLMYMGETVESNTFRKAIGKADEFVENRLSLDIYVLSNAYNDAEKQKTLANMLLGVYGLGMGHRAFVDYETYKGFDKRTQFIIRVASTIGKVLPLRFIIWLHEVLSRKLEKKDADYYFESNGHGMQRMYKKDWLGEGQLVEVDDMEIRIPRSPIDYLEAHGYGRDIMTMPPANMRKPTHGVKSPDLV